MARSKLVEKAILEFLQDGPANTRQIYEAVNKGKACQVTINQLGNLLRRYCVRIGSEKYKSLTRDNDIIIWELKEEYK